MSIKLLKTYPPCPLSEISYITDITNNSLTASLSGNLDDYDISHITHPGLESIQAKAKLTYQKRYRTAAQSATRSEQRLLAVEQELQELRSELVGLKELRSDVVELRELRSEVVELRELRSKVAGLQNEVVGLRVLKEQYDRSETHLRRSQMYTLLLLIIETQLFTSLPYDLQQKLRSAGFANLPQIFVIWWMAWNGRDPLAFPLPASMSRYTLPPRLLTFSLQLFNQHNGESWKGVIVRQAWEKLEKKDRVGRDLMIHCWCGKKDNDLIRNTIAHPDTTKKDAQELLTQDLYGDLQYLFPRAMTYVSTSDVFTQNMSS